MNIIGFKYTVSYIFSTMIAIQQDLDWYCGLVVCNYAVGGNTPAGEMYKVK